MKKVFLVYAVLLVAIASTYFGYIKKEGKEKEAKQKALAVSNHSAALNESLEQVMNAYYSMTEGFVNADTVAVNKHANELKTALENLKMDDLKKDTLIYETALGSWDNTKNEIQGMLSDETLETKRESLNLFSNELFTLLLTIRYDLAKLYWQECASAFGEDTPGNWISKLEHSINPYGKKDCASVKKLINFMPADSTKK